MTKTIRKGWQLVSLDEIKASKKHAINGGPFGSKLVTKYYVNEGVPVIRGTNLPNDCRFSFQDFVFVSEQKADELIPNNAHPGDIIFTQRGTLGQVGLIPKNSPYNRFVVSQSQMKLTVDESKADPHYVFYFFRSTNTIKEIQNLAFSSGVPHINLQILREFKILLPPLETQHIISSILSAYDDLIENNTRRIAILEEMARMIYQEWFVKFRFPGYEQAKFVDSAMGKIPEGWKAGKLIEFCQSTSYGFTASAQKEPVGPNFLRITDIVPDMIDWNNVPYCQISEKDIDKYLLKEGDIVVARTGATVGYAKRLNRRHPKSIYASYLVRLRLKNIWEALYAGILVESSEYKAFIKANASGAAQPQANAQVLTSIPIVMPNEKTLQQFHLIVQPLCDQKEILEMKNINLRQTRDLLLPRLISGELDVSDLDIPIER